jgi:hypothetical protein
MLNSKVPKPEVMVLGVEISFKSEMQTLVHKMCSRLMKNMKMV